MKKVVFSFFDNMFLLFVNLFTSSKLDFYTKILWALLNLKGWQDFLGRGMFNSVFQRTLRLLGYADC